MFLLVTFSTLKFNETQYFKPFFHLKRIRVIQPNTRANLHHFLMTNQKLNIKK